MDVDFMLSINFSRKSSCVFAFFTSESHSALTTMPQAIVPQPIEAVDEVPTVKVQVDFPKDLWLEARGIAIQKDKTAKQMVIEAVEAWLKGQQSA